jgi:sugar O-acyltransferase (sialic acid O-acetyltransferase NeuD family)
VGAESARRRGPLGDVPIFVTVGSPAARRTLVERVRAAGGRFAPAYHIPGPAARNVMVGEGTAIMAYVSIGASAVIGRHVQIMPLSSIDGECTIGDFTTVAQMAAISGRVVVAEGVFVGVGARIVNELDEPLTIGTGATIGAGAVVTRSVPPGRTFGGNPAQELRSLAAARRR